MPPARPQFTNEQKPNQINQSPLSPVVPGRTAYGAGIKQIEQETIESRASPRSRNAHDGAVLGRGADPELAALLSVAARICDALGDGKDAREQMLADCRALAPHLRQDLLQHFHQAYGEAVVVGRWGRAARA